MDDSQAVTRCIQEKGRGTHGKDHHSHRPARKMPPSSSNLSPRHTPLLLLPLLLVEWACIKPASQPSKRPPCAGSLSCASMFLVQILDDTASAYIPTPSLFSLTIPSPLPYTPTLPHYLELPSLALSILGLSLTVPLR